MLDNLSAPKRAAYLRGVVADYLQKLSTLLPQAQQYDAVPTHRISDDKLCRLVEFGLNHSGSPLRECTSLQAALMVIDSTGRYSADMNRPTAGGSVVDGRLSRRVTTAQIRERFGLSERQMKKEMKQARDAVACSLQGAA